MDAVLASCEDSFTQQMVADPAEPGAVTENEASRQGLSSYLVLGTLGHGGPAHVAAMTALSGSSQSPGPFCLETLVHFHQMCRETLGVHGEQNLHQLLALRKLPVQGARMADK